MKNRLNLNFQLVTAQERRDFTQQYLPTLQNPTSDELETIANYILWGKDGGVDSGEIEIQTRNNTWTQNESESLDALAQSESFVESSLHPLSSPHYVATKPAKFSRAEARKDPQLLSQLEPLWRQIDQLELLISFYDLAHNKRKKEIRQELLSRFTPLEIASIKEKSTHLNIYQYLKRRHLLVEMRREQFSISDMNKPSMITPHQPIPTQVLLPIEPTSYPFTPMNGSNYSRLIYQSFNKLIPSNFNELNLKLISKFIWHKPSQIQIDFTNEEHLNNIINYLKEIDICPISETFWFYVSGCTWGASLPKYTHEIKIKPLSELDVDELYEFNEDGAHCFDINDKKDVEGATGINLYLDLLLMKCTKCRNQDIAIYLNKKYNKSYTANYISTILHKKILPEIAAAATLHRQIIENLFFKENFKICNTCGKTLLLNEQNFVHKASSPDGFTSRCKDCDKEYRARRKK